MLHILGWIMLVLVVVARPPMRRSCWSHPERGFDYRTGFGRKDHWPRRSLEVVGERLKCA